MSWLRDYLLSITCGAFAVSLCLALVRQERLARVVKLCGGCLMAILVLQPLLGLPLPEFETLLPSVVSQDPVQAAAEKNEALLADLIRQQTEQAIRDELVRQGIAADFHLELQMDDAVGAPVPWAIELRSACSEAQRARFSAYLEDALGIPPTRQDWRPE